MLKAKTIGPQTPKTKQPPKVPNNMETAFNKFRALQLIFASYAYEDQFGIIECSFV